MARTPGSGWGAGPMLWQICPKCGKKKCYYDPISGARHYQPFRCTSCKERSDSDTLIPEYVKSREFIYQNPLTKTTE